MIDETDVERVAAAARPLPPAGASSGEEDFLTALFVTVLDYQQQTATVRRALEHFRVERAELRSLDALEDTMARFVDDREGNVELAVHLWGYRLWTRAQQLRGLCAYFRSIGVVDEVSLVRWAHGSEFRTDFEGRVKGLGRAVYESLVMRQGVDSVKPDVHVRRFAEAAVGRRLNDGDLVEVVSRAAAATGLTAQELDLRIWNAAVSPPGP